jgi:hypothetical protein
MQSVTAFEGEQKANHYATIPIVPVRSCHVSFLDSEGIRHAVEVQAESLYEAGVIAISKFREHDCSPGIGSHLEIEIRSSVVHTITVGKIQNWLEGGARSPNEAAMKAEAEAATCRVISGQEPRVDDVIVDLTQADNGEHLRTGRIYPRSRLVSPITFGISRNF